MADQGTKLESLPLGTALPRITIQFCTQCKWMLRAAYYAQELLSTFSVAIGEVALQPSTGGTFVVSIHHRSSDDRNDNGVTGVTPVSNSTATAPSTTVLWDRKVDGGFPETKELKRRVRDVIEPGRNLGHVDRDHARPVGQQQQTKESQEEERGDVKNEVLSEEKAACEDCQ